MDQKSPNADSERMPPTKPAAAPRVMRLDAEILFRDGSEVEIIQSGDVYRLRRTRMGKLILTK